MTAAKVSDDAHGEDPTVTNSKTPWAPRPVIEVMRPTAPWEGADEPLEPVPRGLASTPQNGLRDPCLLDTDDGQRWLFYAASGEHALGVTEITGPPDPTSAASHAASGEHALGVTEIAGS